MKDSYATEQRLRAFLDHDEKLLWSGAPRKGLLLRSGDLFLIPFSILWGGFAIFWEAMAIASGPVFFMLWGVPFVVVGIYLIIGRFFVDAMIRARTLYALTDSRVLIVSGLRSTRTKSLSLRTLTDMTLDEKADGSGTISFGRVPGMMGMMQGMNWPGMDQVPQWELPADSRTVYNLVREAQKTAA